MSFIHIILFTFVSEDLACITVGMLIHDGKMDLWTGILGCTTGIFIGDLGLWLIGRLSSMHMLKWSWLQKRLPEKRLERLSEWFDRRGWQMVLAARFLPGTRFPVYVGAGMLGRRALRFAVPALLAALIWTPTLVLLVVWLGSKIVDPLERYFGSGWVAIVVAIGLVFVALRFIESLTAELGREKWIARMSRCWRWEFWPMWLFYLPLVPWIAWLSLRHRGFTTITAANPGIPHSGIVGESKYDILKPISPVFAARTERVTARDAAERVRAAEDIMSRESWTFPVIVKPDAGQRGAGVRLARDHSALKAAMEEHDDAILLQEYHAGPFEAGIFYVRRPGAARGEIFSITDKHPPVLVGDGESTVEAMIWRHPRYRMQARVFLRRWAHRREDVLLKDERLLLAVAGNHCQGTLFADGSHLLTPALLDAVEQALAPCAAFGFGRLDARYADAEELKQGRGFKIIEVNGATSESTNIYDPSWSIWRAYAVLARQWKILFEIGAANRKRGVRVTKFRELWCEVRKYYRERDTSLLSD